MLLNTSFNLAGFPIVENEEFLKFTVENSEFKYVYKPKSIKNEDFNNR